MFNFHVNSRRKYTYTACCDAILEKLRFNVSCSTATENACKYTLHITRPYTKALRVNIFPFDR